MMLPTIPVGEFTPDQPAFENPGTSNVNNVIPLTDKTYGPMPEINEFGAPIGARAQGAYSCMDSGGNISIFAGDIRNLWQYTSSSLSPVNVSQAVNGYSTSPDEKWNFSLFGQRVIATNYTNPVQSYTLDVSAKFGDLANGGITSLTLTPGSGYTNGVYTITPTATSGSGFSGTVTVSGGILSSYVIGSQGNSYPQNTTFSVPSGAGGGTGGMIVPTIATVAPQGRYMAIIKGFLCLANTTDANYGAQPQRVWWSSDNDPTNWPPPGGTLAATLQSSYNDLVGDRGWIKGIVGDLGTADGAVFMERGIYRIVYVGPPVVFDFFTAEGVKGTPAPGSICQFGAYVYYLGEDGFYQFDGSNSTPIGYGKVDNYFFSRVDLNNLDKITSSVDPQHRIIWWAYPSTASNGVCDSMIGIHWPTGRWTQLNDFAGIDVLFRSLTLGYTLDTMDQFGTLDQITPTLDSRQWTGGNLILSAFDSSHALSLFNGANMGQATIDTTEAQPFEGQFTFLSNVQPLVDGTTSLTFTPLTRDSLGANYTVGTPATFDSFSNTCPLTANARYMRGRITIPKATVWNNISGVRIEAEANGVL